MKQAFVSKNGVFAHDVPPPSLISGGVLVDVAFSCISAGTEMSAVTNAGKSLLKRALEEPKKLIPMAIDTCLTRGPKALLSTVKGATGGEFGKPLGYTAAGTVTAVGNRCIGFAIGNRVAICGVGYANHASVASVPQNMTALIPDSVSFEEASTVAVGCIAMQGIRRLEPIPGETVIVMGLGILGMIGLQLLKSVGCRVIGIDINEDRLSLASQLGCDLVFNGKEENIVEAVGIATNGKYADGALFTAATNSSEPMSNCFKMLRRKGRFVLVGVSGMEIKREDIYSKEIDFRMATSYGAGRYDEQYEAVGLDYPVEWVRWTENRNMQEYLRLISEGDLKIKELINGIYDIENVNEAYQSLKNPEKPLIVLLKYEQTQRETAQARWPVKASVVRAPKPGAIVYAMIGAGSFARSMHLPNMESMRDKYHLRAVMSRTGTNAAFLANLYGAKYATTDYNEILRDPKIQMVMICTRHDLHASYAIQALRAGKAVFVEKPAAVEHSELEVLMQTIRETGKPYMVGFNRRFSEYAKEIRRAIANRKEPLNILYTMNAGYIPLDSWVHGKSGGGRIVGEGCHIIDMLTSIVGFSIQEVSVAAVCDGGGYYSPHDNVAVSLLYADGSAATMLYTAAGSKDNPKETMNIWCGKTHLYMKDYTMLTAAGMHIHKLRRKAPAKGHWQELVAFYNSIKTGDGYPIPLAEIEETTKVTLLIRDKAVEAAGLVNG